MNDFLDEVEIAVKHDHFYLALFCSLAIPDICGALESCNGQASGQKYKDWFNNNLKDEYDGILDGSNCYAFRCSALHQGRAEHKGLGYKKLIFVDPTTASGTVLHRNILNDALNLDVSIFCRDMITAARRWMSAQKDNANYEKNQKSFLKRYKGGLPPYIIGIDVIS